MLLLHNRSLYQVKRKKHILYVHFTQLLVGEYQVSYEANVARRLSIGQSIGFKTGAGALISTRVIPSIVLNNRDAYYIFSLLDDKLSSIYYSTYLKWLLSKPKRKSDTYLGFEPFTRVTWGDVYYEQNINLNNVEVVGKQKVHKDIFELGLKVLLGHNFKPIKLSSNLGFCFNLFYGFSMRYKVFNDSYYKFKEDNYTLQDIDKIEFSHKIYDQDIYSTLPFVTVHLGLKMGLGWGKANY